MYKCVVSNKFGEINANLALNIEVAPVIRSVSKSEIPADADHPVGVTGVG